jgi:hypothetical protein
MKKQIIAALLTAATIFASNLASAGTVVINQTFDLANPDQISSKQLIASSDLFDPSTLIHVGDTVDLTYNFLPGQALRLASTGGTQSFFASLWQDGDLSTQNTSVFTIGNTSFNLIGASSSFSSVINGADQSAGRDNLGAIFTGTFLANGDSVSFTGIHASFNVTALQGGQSYYNQSYLSVKGDNLAVTAVPEPETYAMMVAGLSLLAFMQRRRTAKKQLG